MTSAVYFKSSRRDTPAREPSPTTTCGHCARCHMVFTKHLREGIRRGRIRCSIRIWTRPHVKVAGRYRMDEGHIVVDSITAMAVADLTYDLARESGFESVEALLRIAKHGRGENVYLIRFHYLPAGAWDTPQRHRQRIGSL